MKRAAASLLFFISTISAADAAGVPQENCDKIRDALKSLLELNLKVQNLSLRYTKESAGVLGEMLAIDRRAFDTFKDFEKTIADGFSDVRMDTETVVAGVGALQELCPSK